MQFLEFFFAFPYQFEGENSDKKPTQPPVLDSL